MAYTPEYVTAPDGREFRVGSPTEREQLLAKGYKLAEPERNEHEDHQHWAGTVRTKDEFADNFDDEKAPESKPAPAKPAPKAVTPAVETSKPAK